jgi:hypothetical protein
MALLRAISRSAETAPRPASRGNGREMPLLPSVMLVFGDCDGVRQNRRGTTAGLATPNTPPSSGGSSPSAAILPAACAPRSARSSRSRWRPRCAELIWAFHELSDRHGGWAAFYQVGHRARLPLSRCRPRPVQARRTAFPLAVVRQHERLLAFANLFEGAGKEELSIDLMRHRTRRPTASWITSSSSSCSGAPPPATINLGMAPCQASAPTRSPPSGSARATPQSRRAW